jgi:2-polyprenyl-3-methyl-5-hydroxy-6-metoxy-1,4-benzoquinol methylase
MAANLIETFVTPESNALDLGCGIGIVTERVARIAGQGHVWACDLSERNIEYAQQTVTPENVTFFVADILDDFESVRQAVKTPLDLIMMVDVLEHLPISKHEELFRKIRGLCSQRAHLVLTYPSPQYQRYLKEKQPQELQIVDQVIELEHVLTVAENAEFHLHSFALKTIWLRNQYVHCVLQTDPGLSEPEERHHRLLERLTAKVLRITKHFFLYPWRRRKYIKNVSIQ